MAASRLLHKLNARMRSLSPSHKSGASSHRGRTYSPSPSSQQSDGKSSKKLRDFYAAADRCRTIDCKATIIVENAKFYLAHASDYFRDLFMADEASNLDDRGPGDPLGVLQAPQHAYLRHSPSPDLHRLSSHVSLNTQPTATLDYPPQSMGSRTYLPPNEYEIVVGKHGKYAQKKQFQWFLETVIPNPVLREISDETLEVLMRLSLRFQARGLQIRCVNFMREHSSERAPMVVLFWLVWCVRARYPVEAVEACLHAVARLPLTVLEQNRHLIGDPLFGDLMAAKLRATFMQSVGVYKSIHVADHFTTELRECPICRKTGTIAQPYITIHCSPCRGIIACQTCIQSKPCLCDPSMQYHAVYHCKHGTRVMGETTMDCHCQVYEFHPKSVQKCEGGTYSFKSGQQEQKMANGLAPMANPRFV